MNQSAQKQLLKYLICVLLAGITFAAFAQVANCAFIAFDDRNYIVGNFDIQKGFSWPSVKWALCSFHSNNWHPLTWFSHILDCRLYGLEPSGHHLTNLAFHIANTLLLFLLLQNLTAKIWPSAFVALMFAIHPMHVESVAWVSERKDMLSTFFFLLTLLAYSRYVELIRTKQHSAWMVYVLSLSFFVAGLMSKPMLVSLPGILLLLDFWPLRRFEFPLKNQPKTLLRRLLIEKIPFILLAALSCWITYIAQNTTGAVKSTEDFPLTQRLEHISVSYCWYLLKFIWPVNLSIFYPYRTGDTVSASDEILTCLLLIALTAMAVKFMRKHPWFLFGWLWFIGTLVPVIGLVQVGNQAYADRYTYLPYIGLFIAIAWEVPELLARWPYQRPVIWAAALIIGAACFWRTVIEVHYWKDGFTLFNRAIALDAQDEMPWFLLGLEYETHGNNDKAIDCMTRATTLDYAFGWAWHDLGRMLVIKGDYAAAINAFQTAIPWDQYKPDTIEIYNDLADAYYNTGQYAQAIAAYQNSLQLSPDQPLVLNNLGQSFFHDQQPDQAIATLQQAVSLEPGFANAQYNLAMFLGSTGHNSEAIPHYRKVIELDTNNVIALNNLAWILATDPDPRLRDGKEAMLLAEHACERTRYQVAFLIGTLAAADAEAGRFADAVTTAKRASGVAAAHGQKTVAERNNQLMLLYQSGQAFHMSANAPPQKPSS